MVILYLPINGLLSKRSWMELLYKSPALII